MARALHGIESATESKQIPLAGLLRDAWVVLAVSLRVH